MKALLARWNAIFEEPVSVRCLALARIAMGPIVLLHLQPFLAAARAGRWYAEAFYVPYASWYPEPEFWFYRWLLRAAAVAAVLLSLGLFTRLAAAATASLVAYNFFLSQTHYHHNAAFLVASLACLALTPCGRVLSIDAWWRRRRDDRAVAWALWLLRFEMASVYFSSGLSKLLDPDWRGGLVTFERVRRYREKVPDGPLPGWFEELIAGRDFHWLFAKVTIATELFIAVGLWFRTTRLAALWVGFWFHVFIQVSARVQVFSYLCLALFLVWVTPSTRDRVLTVRAAWLRHAVRALDWLARFDVRLDPEATGVRLRDRDGTELAGAAAVRVVLSRLPLTFLVGAPLLLPGVRRLWDRLGGSDLAPSPPRP